MIEAVIYKCSQATNCLKLNSEQPISWISWLNLPPAAKYIAIRRDCDTKYRPAPSGSELGGEVGFYCISLVEAHRWDVEQKNVDILQYFTHFRNEPLYYEKWKVQTFQLYFISIHPMMLMKPLFKLLPKLKCQKLKIKTSVKHFSLYLLYRRTTYIEPLVNSLQVLVKLF